MGSHVLGLQEIDRSQVGVVGGKGAQLGELARIGGIRVPAGFCVTTDAFRRVLQDVPAVEELLDRLSRLRPDDREEIDKGSAEVRQALEAAPIPDDVAAAITGELTRLGDQVAYAVRSSATAEDLPTASFAGQQDTYLNVVGAASVLRHVSRCWASLFTERAVTYRLRNGFDHHRVHMAVVVQQMVFPQAAGVLFTADPITSNRRVACVEAGFGLGEALVSGLVNADVYRVRDGEIVSRAVAAKDLAIEALPGGGTREQEVEPDRREQPALTDEQVLELVRLGRRIEAHFGRPQDIEWCLAGDGFQVVQSRPITTLFPVPETGDDGNHVFVSVGHQQMMTDAMKPLGLSVWQLTTPRRMAEAGGRLFVDVTAILATPSSRAAFLGVAGGSDPLTGDALRTVMDREGFLPPPLEEGAVPPIPGAAPTTIETDPDVVTELIGQAEASVAALKRDIASKSGAELVDFVLGDFQELRRVLFDARSSQAVMAGMQATRWLNDNLLDWLGEKNAADTLTLSAPHNVTSEMGLALLDVADVIRPHREVVAFLQDAQDDFLDELDGLPGGAAARDAIVAYLDRYGMRCVGEIDITRPRWSERPAALLPMILTNVRNFEAGAGARRFEQGREEARAKEQELLERLRALPDGEAKAAETKRMIDRVRTFIGYREYPKYFMISRYFVYKQALLAEAARLVRAGVLSTEEDMFFLTLQEFHDVVRTNEVDDELVRRRREEFRSYEALTPPRVLTSDGEAVAGAYNREDLPEGALVGLAVSSGTVEGRARVVLDMADADLEPGDILVTAHTDPSWSPLFVAISGLVTEVGGLMTHGAVVAREYGLPAVVGLENATRLIQDGQRIRVNGTDGYVEVLPAT
ncbi:rifamycin-inactivating phosphotransferase [Nocardia sp. NRRL S-836]|uniref:rifamycin-inactivating phosphotransferase n=1 Tax=Nocardia sp. NRRL S-836 TaxID=1519492 RepID=UPI0006B03DE9|nr:rifamycin-inactivating phosphotransferase [Nocardia sp. NRRL S-836]KOV86682.1 phosphoenolpyruvate synthase [Nocardia sp. NRRL S-836]